MAVDVEQVDVDITTSPLPVPDMSDANSITEFKSLLAARPSQYGVKLIAKLVDKCSEHFRLANKQYTHLKNSIARLNGDVTPELEAESKERKLRSTAEKFYNSLNTAGLRMQCKLFDVDYDSYASQEDIIDVLVSKHVELNV